MQHGLNNVLVEHKAKIERQTKPPEVYNFLNDTIISLNTPPNEALNRTHDRFVSDIEKPARDLFAECSNVHVQFVAMQRANSLDASQCEALLWRLSIEMVVLTATTAEAYNRMHLAHTVLESAYSQRFTEPIGGTKDDRTAYAKTHTEQERIYHMFQFAYWNLMKEQLAFYKGLHRSIEQYLSRRVYDRNELYT